MALLYFWVQVSILDIVVPPSSGSAEDCLAQRLSIVVCWIVPAAFASLPAAATTHAFAFHSVQLLLGLGFDSDILEF